MLRLTRAMHAGSGRAQDRAPPKPPLQQAHCSTPWKPIADAAQAVEPGSAGSAAERPCSHTGGEGAKLAPREADLGADAPVAIPAGGLVLPRGQRSGLPPNRERSISLGRRTGVGPQTCPGAYAANTPPASADRRQAAAAAPAAEPAVQNILEPVNVLEAVNILEPVNFPAVEVAPAVSDSGSSSVSLADAKGLNVSVSFEDRGERGHETARGW